MRSAAAALLLLSCTACWAQSPPCLAATETVYGDVAGPACCMNLESGRRNPSPVWGQAMRTEFGRPSSEHAKLWGAGVIEWVPRRWNGSELMT